MRQGLARSFEQKTVWPNKAFWQIWQDQTLCNGKGYKGQADFHERDISKERHGAAPIYSNLVLPVNLGGNMTPVRLFEA